MKKLLLIAGFIFLGLNAHAGIDKGNGGSGSESSLAAQQAQLESVALKIKVFFLKNKAALAPGFPEFNINTLIYVMESSTINVVDNDELFDHYGIQRTCLNFPDSSLIQCRSSALDALFDQPMSLFILVLHEYLGLLEVEMTSPNNPNTIDGYRISKRIATFVTKVNDYDVTKVNDYDLVMQDSDTSSAPKNKFVIYNVDYGIYQHSCNSVDTDELLTRQKTTLRSSYAFTNDPSLILCGREGDRSIPVKVSYKVMETSTRDFKRATYKSDGWHAGTHCRGVLEFKCVTLEEYAKVKDKYEEPKKKRFFDFLLP